MSQQTTKPTKLHVRPANTQISLRIRPVWSITKTRLFKYIEIFNDKSWTFSDKSLIFFIFRGGSNEYSQSMFLSRNKKNNVYPCKPQFYYIKVGFKGVKII